MRADDTERGPGLHPGEKSVFCGRPTSKRSRWAAFRKAGADRFQMDSPHKTYSLEAMLDTVELARIVRIP